MTGRRGPTARSHAALSALPASAEWPAATQSAWAATAVLAGRLVDAVWRKTGNDAGAVLGGRVALALAPTVLERLATGRQVVLVTGTRGRTTTAHLLATVLRTAGPVAHNDTGAITADGAVAALITQPNAGVAVLEVGGPQLSAVAASTCPVVIVLLGLTRNGLDRGQEVRVDVTSVTAALQAHPDAVLVANADDPTVVWACADTPRAVWISTGAPWSDRAESCPRCGERLPRSCDERQWRCACGLRRPPADWIASGTSVSSADGAVVLDLKMFGGFDVQHAMAAVAGASLLGVDAGRAAAVLQGRSG
jgi:lipid II isoglutaminyl synthase (glutamine-hydrolysing)